MRFRDDQLIGLRVETVMGERVGTLTGFVIDTETSAIVQYVVRTRGWVAACFPGFRELLIAHDQVVSIDARRMIVRDGAPREASGKRRKRVVPSMQPQPLTSSQ